MMNRSTQLVCSRQFLHRLRFLTGPAASSPFPAQPLPLPLPHLPTSASRFFSTVRYWEPERGLQVLTPEISPRLKTEILEKKMEKLKRYSPNALPIKPDILENKLGKLQWLIKNFIDAKSLDDTLNWMRKIDIFEQKHFRLRPEYRVIGELMNLVKETEGKERFLLLKKLNRAVRMVELMELNDPNDPSNYGVIQNQQDGRNKKEDNYLEFDDIKEKDDKLVEKLGKIDKNIEEKLALLDHTFGRKGKDLEEEIKELLLDRNSLTEQKRTPLYRKGFDVKIINVNRTQKVTEGTRVTSYTAMLVCGNYNGVVGFAKAKGSSRTIALQKAHEKCFQNLYFIERHEEHTITHAIQTSFKKTKVYLWPARPLTGMKAGKTVETILHLAGIKNVKSKIIGSRNPHNSVKAVFKALNAIETPQDMQEKFGRTVVDSYLL